MKAAAPSATFPADPQLRAFHDEVAAIRARSATLLTGLEDAQYTWRPAPGAWSLAQCLGHLTVTGERYLDGVEKAIATARRESKTGRGPFRHGPLGGLFVRSMEPPAKLRVKTFEVFRPPPGQALAEGRHAFLAVQDRLQQALLEADGLDLGRVKAASPVSPLVRLPLFTCFGVLVAHERRHLWQAERVRAHPDFPVIDAAQS